MAFQQTWDQLLGRIASLAAFVQYAAANQDQTAITERMILSAQQIVRVTNATADRLEGALQNAQPSTLPVDVHYEVRRLRASVSDELIQVNQLEPEVSW